MISIIVPCYNAEATIEECFKSLINQSFKDVELIFIDDGSMDRTLELLNSFKEQHSELAIQVLHQENKGVSSARNLALSVANGEFLSFVDADDTVEYEYLEKLYETLQGPEVTMSVSSYKAIMVDQNTVETHQFREGLYTEDEALAYLMVENGPQGFLWNKLFISNKIKENNIIFHSDIFMAEDLLFVIEYLRQGGKVRIINDSLYNYVVHSTSSNQTRLESLKAGYERYYDNFLECIDRIDQLIPSSLSLAKKAVNARRGKIAIQYLRANGLMKRRDKTLTRKLRQLGFEGKKDFLNSFDANNKSVMMYYMVLYLPKLAVLRDWRHYDYHKRSKIDD